MLKDNRIFFSADYVSMPICEQDLFDVRLWLVFALPT